MTQQHSGLEHVALEINGLQFHGLALGPADGELVLFLHGFPEFADTWLNIMHPVAVAGFRAVSVDQRGYSPDARPANMEDYTVGHLAADVLGFADCSGAPGSRPIACRAFNAAQFHLVGHDWGGAAH